MLLVFLKRICSEKRGRCVGGGVDNTMCPGEGGADPGVQSSGKLCEEEWAQEGKVSKAFR